MLTPYDIYVYVEQEIIKWSWMENWEGCAESGHNIFKIPSQHLLGHSVGNHKKRLCQYSHSLSCNSLAAAPQC